MNTDQNPTPEQFRRAAYIVGCLIHDGVINPDFTKIHSGSIAWEHIQMAMRITAACIRDTEAKQFDAPMLPFSW